MGLRLTYGIDFGLGNGNQSNPTYYCKQWNWDDYVIYVFSQNDSEEELDEDFTVSASDLEETLPDG